MAKAPAKKAKKKTRVMVKILVSISIILEAKMEATKMLAQCVLLNFHLRASFAKQDTKLSRVGRKI